MTKVKICGMMSEDDVLCAVENGADFIGFVFAPSKRELSFDTAKYIIDSVDLKETQTVGVFVNPALDTVYEAIEQLGLDYVQLHGDESQAFTKAVHHKVIKAFPSNSRLSFKEKFSYSADYILIDSPREQYYGGSGQAFDWRTLDSKDTDTDRLALAGGLNSDNVKTALLQAKPQFVDVSSGVETNGRKDPVKIQAFIDEVRRELNDSI